MALSRVGYMADEALGSSPRLLTLFVEFFVIGATSFGGGVLAYERILLTEKRRWVTDDAFKAMLAISQTLPGLNSVNLAILAGDRLRGVWGAVAAACGLLLPGCAFVLAAGLFFLKHSGNQVAVHFVDSGAAVATGLLMSVVFKLGARDLRSPRYLLIAVVSFALMSLVQVPLLLVLAIVIPISLYLHRPKRERRDDVA